jgi:hypothetical protein
MLIPAQPGWRIVSVTTESQTSMVAEFSVRDVIAWREDSLGSSFFCYQSPSARHTPSANASELSRPAAKSLIGSIENTASSTTMWRARPRSYSRATPRTSRKNAPSTAQPDTNAAARPAAVKGASAFVLAQTPRPFSRGQMKNSASSGWQALGGVHSYDEDYLSGKF